MLHLGFHKHRFAFSDPSSRAPLGAVAATTLRFTVAAVCLTVVSVGPLLATPKADGVSSQIVDALAKEFMKGFRAMDDDQDGKVDVAAMIQTLKAFGYGQAQPVRRGRGGGADPFDLFEQADADGDGILRAGEAGPYVRGTEYFQDGEVTWEEYQKAWAELAARRGGRGGRARGGGGRGSGGGGRGGGGQSSDIEFLAALDVNGDRTLTAEEARATIEAEIGEAMDTRVSLDVNQDGEISAREYGLSQPSTGREVDADGLDGHARGHFEREDLDRNGVITLDEIAERAARDPARRLRALQLGVRIARADANGDGKLALSELQAESGEADWTVLGVTQESPLGMAQLYPRLYSADLDQSAELDRALPSQ